MRLPSRRRVSSAFGLNMTRMIDIVFLFIIFFMLVSQFSSAEHVKVELPDPYKSLARDVTVPEKVVLNIQLGEDYGPPTYSLGALRLESLGELAERLEKQQAAQPELQVIVRADRGVEYLYVREALEVLAARKVQVFHIAAQPGEGHP